MSSIRLHLISTESVYAELQQNINMLVQHAHDENTIEIYHVVENIRIQADSLFSSI